MQAQEIIAAMLYQTYGDLRGVLAGLEDGAALTAIGVTDADQAEVEEAHAQVKATLAKWSAFRIYDEDYCEVAVVEAADKDAALTAHFDKHHLHPQHKHLYLVLGPDESIEAHKASVLEASKNRVDHFSDDAGNEYDFR